MGVKATVDILGKHVLVEWSSAADRKLKSLAEPLLVEMELYFSCLIRKAVRFGADAKASSFAEAAPNLRIGFRPVMTRACSVNDFTDSPPLTDFLIVKPEAYVPRRVAIDFKNGKWIGDFFLKSDHP